MDNKTNFSIQKIIGSKIYRYIDNHGNKGRIHFSRSPLTPVICRTKLSGATYLDIAGEKIIVSSLSELDAINNALNNYRKSLKMVFSTPSKEIAKTNPELYIKVLDAARIAVCEESDRRAKNPIRPLTENEGLQLYATLDDISKKTFKIKRATLRERLRDQAEINEKYDY